MPAICFAGLCFSGSCLLAVMNWLEQAHGWAKSIHLQVRGTWFGRWHYSFLEVYVGWSLSVIADHSFYIPPSLSPSSLQAHVGNQFLEDHLALLQPLAAGSYLSPRVVNLALQYLTRAIEVKKYYTLLKPHIEPLLTQVGEGSTL